MIDTINKFKAGTRIMVACPLKIKKGRKLADELSLLLSKGFARILVEGEVKFIEELIGPVERSNDPQEKESRKAGWRDRDTD